MAVNTLILGSALELRELHRRLLKAAKAKVMLMDKVSEVWKWLDKEYSGRTELTAVLIGELQVFQPKRHCKTDPVKFLYLYTKLDKI